MVRSLCNGRLKKITFPTLIAVGFAAMITSNYAQASSNDEPQNVVLTQREDIWSRCIPEAVNALVTTQATTIYTNVNQGTGYRVPKDYSLIRTGQTSGDFVQVRDYHYSPSKLGWVNKNTIKYIGC